jgi:hypothetical protein
MGLWNALDMINVMITNTEPSRENTEHTRSITLIALSWDWVRDSDADIVTVAVGRFKLKQV